MRNKKISLRISDQGLVMGEKMVPRMQLTGRSIEIEAATGDRKNLIVLSKGGKLIFTLDDSETNVKDFTNELGNWLPLAEDIEYSFTEKLIRKLKL